MQTCKIKLPDGEQRDPQKISKVLSKSKLGQIVEKAFFLLSLQELLIHCLPEGIPPESCQVANLHEKTLVLTTSQPHFATRLRYQQEEILEKFNRILDEETIDKLEVKVRFPNRTLSD